LVAQEEQKGWEFSPLTKYWMQNIRENEYSVLAALPTCMVGQIDGMCILKIFSTLKKSG